MARLERQRRGQTGQYSWLETAESIELRLRLLPGMKRAQLKVSLRDGEREAWRNEVETFGGTEPPALHARLLVQPVFWPKPLVDARLRGAVHLKECSFEVEEEEVSVQGEVRIISTVLLVVLVKAAGNSFSRDEQREAGTDDWWDGVFMNDEAVHAQPTSLDEQSLHQEWLSLGTHQSLPMEQAAVCVQRMAGRLSDADEQRMGALTCAKLARQDGGVAALVAAKAIGQIGDAMRQHNSDCALQVAGADVLSLIDPSTNEACRIALLESALLSAAVEAARRWPSDESLLFHVSMAMLAFATAGDSCVDALLASGGIAILAEGLSRSPMLREISCGALRRLACLGHRRVTVSLIKDGAAAALLTQVSRDVGHGSHNNPVEVEAKIGPRGSLGWRLRCWIVCHILACSDETTTQQQMLSLGVFSAAVSLGRETSELGRETGELYMITTIFQCDRDAPLLDARLSLTVSEAGVTHCQSAGRDVILALLHSRMVGVLTWNCPVSSLRIEARPHVAQYRLHEYLAKSSSRTGAASVRFAALRALREAFPIQSAEYACGSSHEEVSSDDVEFDVRLALSFLDERNNGAASEATKAETFALACETVEFSIDADIRELKVLSHVFASTSHWGDDTTATESVAAFKAVRESVELMVSEASKVVSKPGSTSSLFEQEISEALDLLVTMSSSHGPWRHALCRHGAHSKVVSFLRRHHNHGRRCALACGVIAQLSCSRQEQAALARAEAPALLVEIYDEAVMGVDSSSAQTMADISTTLSNMALNGSRESLLLVGAEEALDSAREDTAPLSNMDLVALVERMRKAPHSAACQLLGCRRLCELLSSSPKKNEESMLVTSAARAERARREGMELAEVPVPRPTAKEFLENGVVPIALQVIERHSQVSAVLSMAIDVISQLVLSEPSTLALVHLAGGVTTLLSVLKEISTSSDETEIGSDGAKVLLAVCRALHHLCATQAALLGSNACEGKTFIHVDVAGPMLLHVIAMSCTSTFSAVTVSNDVGPATASFHAKAALSWLSLDQSGWSRILQDLDHAESPSLRRAADVALEVPLGADLNCLPFADVVSLIRNHGTHRRLVQDGVNALCNGFVLGSLTPALVVDLHVIPVLLDVLKQHSPSASCLEAVMSMLSELTANQRMRPIVLRTDVLSCIWPLLANHESGAHVPIAPSIFLHGCRILRDAVHQHVEDRVLRQRGGKLGVDEGEGWLAVAENKRVGLLEAALPVLLKVIGAQEPNELAALSPCLSALRALSSTPDGAQRLLDAGVLRLAVGLSVVSWPKDATHHMLIDMMHLIRGLLCVSGLPNVSEGDDHHKPSAAAFEGPALKGLHVEIPALVRWCASWCDVSTSNDAHPNKESDATDSKRAVEADRRGDSDTSVAALPTTTICFLSTLLIWETYTFSPISVSDSMDGCCSKTSVNALQLLLARMKLHRALESAQFAGCTAIAVCADRPEFRETLACYGAIKTLLFAMRSHIRSEDVQASAMRALRLIALGSDACISIMVTSNAVAMLSAVLKRYDNHRTIPSNGCGCLGDIILRSADGKMAFVKDKDGTEALVGALRGCCAQDEAFLRGKDALQALAKSDPALVKRIERANGSKFLIN